MKKTFFALLAISFFLFSQGCFDVHRDIKFYPNGSGIEIVHLTLDKSFFDAFENYSSVDKSGISKKYKILFNDNTAFTESVIKDIQKTSGTSLKEISITDKEGGKDIRFEYTFDEPSVLSRIIKEVTFPFSNQLNVVWSTIKFQLEGDVVHFKHVLRKAERSFTDNDANTSFSGLINSRNLYYNVEMAFEVTSSNAITSSGNTLNWSIPMSQIFSEQAELISDMKKTEGIDLPYAELIVKLDKVDKNKSPLLRVMVYNANREPVKVGTGIVLKDNLLVTNFALMNIVEGGGYFSVKLNNDSLAGIDDMKESDIVQAQDMVFLRFSGFEKANPIKIGTMNVKFGQPMKILYYPNTLSSTVYSIDASVTGTKSWKDITLIEVKPSKPLSLEGGALYNEAGEFVGMITIAFDGEVGKIYSVPSAYIKANMK